MIIFLNEMKVAFRDRTLVAHFVLIPLLLYPLMLWLGVTVALLVEAGSEDITLRIGVGEGLDEGIMAAVEDDFSLAPFPVRSDPAPGHAPQAWDAEISSSSGSGGPSSGCLILADLSTERGRIAADALLAAVSKARANAFEDFRDSLGISRGEWEVMDISMSNQAGGRDMGGFILGLLLPATFAVMVSMGCYYTAVDTMAGERERKTLETLLATGAGRVEILTGKYFSVLAAGMISGTLNTASMMICVSTVLGPILRQAGEEISFSLEPGVLLMAFIAALMLSAVLAAGMTASASMARTFKEGQAMVTPIYLLSVMPLVFIQMPGLVFDARTAAVPVLNAVLLLKDSLAGTIGAVPLLVSAASTLLVCGIALKAAAALISREEAVFPGDSSADPRRMLSMLFGRRPREDVGNSR